MLPIPTGMLAGVALAGLALLIASIAHVLRLVRGSVVARLPALPGQDVTFERAGRFDLCAEQPRFGGALAHAGYCLRDAQGRELASAPILFRTTVSGMSSVRISLRAFEVPQPGRYRLLVSGIAADRDASPCALVFTTPIAAQLVPWICAIVLGGAALIAGIVLSSLRAVGKA